MENNFMYYSWKNVGGAGGIMSVEYSYSINGIIRTCIFLLLLFLFSAILFISAVNWRANVLHGVKYNSSLTTSSNSRLLSSEVSFFLEPVEFKSSNDFSDTKEDIDRYGLSFSYSKVDNRINHETEAEALASIHAAAQCKVEGKLRKAIRLYEHALALQPKHPDVLVEYGLFVEKINRDIVAAETMFTKALIYYPNHDLAKKHRSRTQPLVEEIDSQMLGNLDRKRDVFLRIPRGSAPLKRVMREAYVEHVYHTVALEGNTMTLAQTRSILETHLAVGGKSVVEHNEILGMDAALRYLNRSLVHRIGAITVEDILNIHQRVLGYVDPFEAGRLRRTQVYVGGFVPSPPDLVEKEMQEFVDWLNNPNTLRIHPVELAALAHYKFVIIHPFVDGNGRTARLLMNLILMQAGFPPVVVKVEDRLKYYETLKTANEGDLRPFIRLIAHCTDKTLDAYLRFTTEISPPSPAIISDHFTSEDDEKIIPPAFIR